MIDHWDKLLQGELDDLSAHLRDEGEIEMEWKQGDGAQWMCPARRGWYDYHYLACLIIVPGEKRVGIATQNIVTKEWQPHWVSISRLVK